MDAIQTTLRGDDTPAMLIDGTWAAARTGEVIEVGNPARGTVLATIPRGQGADIDRAVAAAKAAFAGWKTIAPRDRGRIMGLIADDLVAETETVARCLAAESGNAIRTQSRPEIGIAAEVFRYFGGLGGELKGETIPINTNMFSYSVREPLGVVGAIIPWNAPLALAALKIAPALVSGNTMVLKAAEDAPLAVLMLAEICARHLPPGVLNVVTGYGAEAGAALTAHPDVAKLTFTGSTETGKAIMHAAADRIVPVSLELGGKSPNIVCPDADEGWVVDGAIAAARFHRQSQSCTTGSRLFIHTSIFDSFLTKLEAKVAGLKIGDPLDEASDIGALVSKRQFERVCGYIEDGLATEGVTLRFGGRPPAEGDLAGGYFAQPTVFAADSNDWRLAREEIFGPVLVAIPWEDEADVLRMANNSHYGLAAFVWTHDLGRAFRMVNALEAGFVQVNQGYGQFPGQSYGGIKQSGMGREHSLEGMLESFTTRKAITFNAATPDPGA